MVYAAFTLNTGMKLRNAIDELEAIADEYGDDIEILVVDDGDKFSVVDVYDGVLHNGSILSDDEAYDEGLDDSQIEKKRTVVISVN